MNHHSVACHWYMMMCYMNMLRLMDMKLCHCPNTFVCMKHSNHMPMNDHHQMPYMPNQHLMYMHMHCYHLPFRIVRFLLPSGDFETVVTNLPARDFPPDELKMLYAMRWGIETSFRELKYTVGLLHFHAKKAEYIYQEIFASLVMYNFTELITSQVVTHSKSRKYAYMADFSVAVHACRQFLQGTVSPPSVEAIISRNLSPVRPGRSSPRKTTQKNSFSFLYRVA